MIFDCLSHISIVHSFQKPWSTPMFLSIETHGLIATKVTTQQHTAKSTVSQSHPGNYTPSLA